MSFKIRSVTTAAIVSGLMTFAAVAAAKYSVSNAAITVVANPPPKAKVKITVTGKSSTLKVIENDTTVTFVSYLNTIDTGNGMRNDHMLKRLGKVTGWNKEKKEKVVSDAFDVKVAIPKDKISKSGGTIDGQLTFRGQTKPVSVTYKVNDKHVTANFVIHAMDFIKVNEGYTQEEKDEVLCNLGVCVDPNVQVTAEFDYAG